MYQKRNFDIVGIDRMRRCRWHKSFCMDDDCTNPRHSFSVPCDSDSPMGKICADCQEFSDFPEFS